MEQPVDRKLYAWIVLTFENRAVVACECARKFLDTIEQTILTHTACICQVVVTF